MEANKSVVRILVFTVLFLSWCIGALLGARLWARSWYNDLRLSSVYVSY
jgi:hypothetical protein